MNSLIISFFCVAIAAASCSVLGYAGPLYGGVGLKGPSAGATVSGPSGTITAASDSGAVGAAPGVAAAYAAAPFVAPAPAVLPAGPAVVEARTAPWAAWGAAPWAPAAVRTIW
ncbi:cuticle protein 16.5-like isoform X2 [Agrilus planipennis]|uniref:Cuticle protein 16.5-like isoform X2 n=1 Tax=Agrilus planipennis TaxID=224129 RepID=A0A1W4WIJ9_AGRPL|nr:cuticle protein 16.5-like isoform X2 [Agrilus planipennis]